MCPNQHTNVAGTHSWSTNSSVREVKLSQHGFAVTDINIMFILFENMTYSFSNCMVACCIQETAARCKLIAKKILKRWIHTESGCTSLCCEPDNAVKNAQRHSKLHAHNLHIVCAMPEMLRLLCPNVPIGVTLPSLSCREGSPP